MPLFHQPVARPLGGDGEPVKLPRKTDGEVADVDHLLHLADPFRADLSRLEGNEIGQGVLVLPKQDSEGPHDLTAFRRRTAPPLLESAQRRCDAGIVLRAREGADASLRFPGGRIDRLQRLARAVAGAGDAKGLQDSLHAFS